MSPVLCMATASKARNTSHHGFPGLPVRCRAAHQSAFAMQIQEARLFRLPAARPSKRQQGKFAAHRWNTKQSSAVGSDLLTREDLRRCAFGAHWIAIEGSHVFGHCDCTKVPARNLTLPSSGPPPAAAEVKR